MATPIEHRVAAHYGRKGLLDVILSGLRQLGVDTECPDPEALAPVDEFHTAGRQMTLKALGMMVLKPGMHVLDAGSGLGGTARVLAREHGCRVTGIDLTPEYVEVANELSARMGLAGQCEFRTGSAADLPFADGTFDAAVTFHVAMNIDDRAGFYAGVTRVLKPGARFCIFDVMKGPTPSVPFPMPWAETGATSFLKSPAETRALVEAAGLEVTAEQSVRDEAITYFDRMDAMIAKNGGPPPLGLHLVTGENAAEKFANYTAALKAHQIDPYMMVARRR
ncbi:MAG: methyltransferase domain-containing protein [Rhizobiaceae bacterium]|nr:methyltransferase domain-containing protein [Rhizobiaceae bacterium]